MTTKTLQGNGVQQVLAKVGIVKRADVQQAMDASDWVEEGVLADAVNNLENAGWRAEGKGWIRPFLHALHQAQKARLKELREQAKRGCTEHALLSTELADVLGLDPHLPKQVVLKAAAAYWRKANGKIPLKKRGELVTTKELTIALGGQVESAQSKTALLDLLKNARLAAG